MMYGGINMEAYLDNAATTQAFPEVCEIVQKLMMTDFGNPSSKHTKGMQAENYINEAKENIAATLKCQSKEIIFTSGGTESNNMALIGAAMANKRAGKHIITTRIEHASVHEPLAFLEELGYEVTYLKVDNLGRVDEKELESLVREDTVIVSIMFVNNEIGAVEDIKKLSEIIKRKNKNTIFHVDAIQAYGKYKVVPKKLGIDLMSVSGHKIHGPKGSGFLYVKENTKIKPIIFGGGQQKGMRSGTENVPAIAGLGLAAKMIYENHGEKIDKLYELKKMLIDGLYEIGNQNKCDDGSCGVVINGIKDIDLKQTAPHIVSASFYGIKSEVLLHALASKGVYVSSGSACSSNHPDLSGTLKAIDVSDELLDSTIRFSFSVNTTKEQIEYALEVISKQLPTLKKFIKQ